MSTGHGAVCVKGIKVKPRSELMQMSPRTNTVNRAAPLTQNAGRLRLLRAIGKAPCVSGFRVQR